MNPITLTSALPEQPPSEFLVFPMGDFDTAKGTFTFDEESAKLVIAEWKAHGIDLSFDYEHAAIQDAGDIAAGAPAAGWFSLEVRKTGLWAVDIKWTQRATEYLTQKEYRYFSPAFTADENKRVTRLINIALTNLPATHDQEPLVAIKALLHGVVALGQMSLDAMSRAVSEAIQEKFGKKDETGSISYPWVCDLYPDKAIFSHEGKLFSVGYSIKGTSAELTGEPVEVVRSYEPASAGSETAPSAAGGGVDELLKKLSEVLDEIKAHRAKGTPAEDPASDTDDDSEAMAKLTTALGTDVVALSAGTNATEVAATILTWKASHDQVATLTAEKAERELVDLLDKAQAGKKFTPAQRPALLALGRKDLPTLKTFLGGAAGVPGVANPATPPAGSGAPVVLSEEEAQIARKLGNKPDDVQKHKNRPDKIGHTGT